MALINAVIVPAKALKDGRHKIRISVAHNGETRYIATDVVIDSAKEFRNGAVVKRPDAAIKNTRIRGLLQKYQQSLDDLPYVDGLSCSELMCAIKNADKYKHRSLLSIYEDYMNNKHCKESSKSTYRQYWANISQFLNTNMLMEQISHSTILGFDNFLRKKNLKPSTIAHNISFLRNLVTFAKRCGYANFRSDPFYGYKYPEPGVRQSWLTVEEVKRIRDLELKKKNLRMCRDLFMLSYYLGGINITDLMDINFNEQTDILHYVRKKTESLPKINPFVEFSIPVEAKEIIARIKDKKEGTIKRYTFGTFFAYNLPVIANMAGIKTLIYYSARKSFSQHAFDLGVPTSVIDYILGHRVDKNGTSLYNYIFVTPQMATDGIRKVLDNLK